MFMYRAAAWFGRINCPERLMGMQTRDEIEDAGAGGVIPVVSERGVKSLLTKLENARTPAPEIPHPTADGLTIDTSDASEGVQPDPVVKPDEKHNTAPPEQESDAAEQQRIAVRDAMEDPDTAQKALLERIRRRLPDYPLAKFKGELFKWLQSRKLGDFTKTSVEQRMELWSEVEAGTFPA